MGIQAEIERQLTGPGGLFEVGREEVAGALVKAYKTRLSSLRELLAGARARRGDAFLLYGDEAIDYGTFAGMVESGAAALAAPPARLGKGERLAVAAANCPEWCLAFWSAIQSGAVLVGLNGWWKADELLYGLKDSGAAVLLADGPRYERLAGRLGELPELRAVYFIGVDPEGAPAPGGAVELRGAFELFSGDGEELSVPSPPIAEDDPAVIFYTSGTTGRPKGAVSTHRAMIANLQDTFYAAVAGTMIAEREGSGGSVLPSGDGQMTGLLTSPLFHVSGCHSNLVVSFAAGARLVIPKGRFDPEVVMATIEKERVSVWSAVPTMIWRVVEHPRRSHYDLSSVVSIAYGGSPAAGELQRRIVETFPGVKSIGNAYGLTETSSVATFSSGTDALEHPGSVGRPMPVVELRIVDPSLPTDSIASSTGLSTGEVGEICVRGPLLMSGYWNKPEATAEVLARGWLRTGDLGYLDSEGRLYVTDRAKDMILRGGENVYCVEIENRLVEHASVAEAAVVGVPHRVLGEEVKAFVRLEPGEAVSVAELRAFVGEALADFKVPAYVELVREPLPRNATGKLLKNLLRGGAGGGGAGGVEGPGADGGGGPAAGGGGPADGGGGPADGGGGPAAGGGGPWPCEAWRSGDQLIVRPPLTESVWPVM